ncbi:MAG TPA: DUF1501 domain-containing protein [Vicinamibacterales bacterium]|mgnify:CR=1 FL=1|nr:DUF1501 domain-containing protein [Vicinamibacterales bacterium]
MGHSHDVPARRNFLKLSARLAALGITSLGVKPAAGFFASEVQAQRGVSDYKALVCVYMFGGNDSNNLIVPAGNYAAYSAARGGTGGVALAANTLLPIPGPGGAAYGLHPSLAEMVPIYNAGYLAFVLNMGALIRPLTKAQYRAGGQAPPNLFSHSDQTTQAQTGSPTLHTGWGGRLLDLFGATDSLSAVSVSSPAIFLDGTDVRSNVIPPGANLGLNGMSFWPPAAADARRQAVNAMVLMDGGNPIREAANRMFADGLQLADTLQASGGLPPTTWPFPTTSIGNQLREVARLIRVRSQMGPGRQVFFCSIGGFDTHSSQMGTHANLLRDLSQALSAFAYATLDLGLAGNITTFTQSEFSRTTQTNGTGTDHAWGGHHMVIGGAVQGGLYGSTPDYILGGDMDTSNRGAWIPTIGSVQFGATLGRWFGATPTELVWAFPDLVNFPAADLGFMRA